MRYFIDFRAGSDYDGDDYDGGAPDEHNGPSDIAPAEHNGPSDIAPAEHNGASGKLYAVRPCRVVVGILGRVFLVRSLQGGT